VTDRAGADTSPVGPAARVQRVLPASPDLVYAQWLDPDALSEWMCPRPARCLRVEVEPTVGGRLRLDIEDSGVEFSVIGRFTMLDRPNQVRFTWTCSTWPDPKTESIVIVSLEHYGQHDTLMTIDHILLPPELVEQHQRGWTSIAGQLADVFGKSRAARHRDVGPTQ
jgi:uncharacterized protein YndB with AHSA1/START domain